MGVLANSHICRKLIITLMTTWNSAGMNAKKESVHCIDNREVILFPQLILQMEITYFFVSFLTALLSQVENKTLPLADVTYGEEIRVLLYEQRK